ncbi:MULTISPECIES: substrate-binding and VWA domain-containing protein [Thermomonospora]|uniref:von Willebrand factor type A n=1 Tax=Thermomonospora curvata (strain ATCC 19995 / DSM 43183 / JCM 3096 / KCTC 9072 / NBRC 15933 / NCIMB 10081 / Henssen B9) TaxID=471852 RepID=D1ADY0_THECD|nr:MULTISPECIES: substrate-binding and VWA domain-containing protein [Thermomonospora]ACY97590.1 von Willebrand factor type A [Thermomonospora curvata DSM 43183]PKK14536.1 MAG: VWA domain-containing protein [Thermomonospora sp. CIF 1]
MGGTGSGDIFGRAAAPPRRRIPRPGLRTGVALLAAALAVAIGCRTVLNAAGCRGEGAGGPLTVAAAPDIAPALTRAIDRFNEAQDTCVHALVRPVDPAAIAVLLSGQGASGSLQRPDVWIPDSSLWTSLVNTSPERIGPLQVSHGPLAYSPVVLGLPQGLVDELRNRGVTADPSWNLLLGAVPGVPGGASAVPPGLVRPQVPDPTRSATGMSALVVADRLLTGRSGRQEIFTALVRAVRENTVPSVEAEFRSLDGRERKRHPVLLVPEQAIFSHNGNRPAERIIALYPREGTLSLDYPFAMTTGEAARLEAARALERALRSPVAAAELRRAGFRGPDGRNVPHFGPFTGVRLDPPRRLPAPPPQAVRDLMQTWSKLTLSTRMLVLFDVSGSMRRRVAPGLSRLQATARVAQSGLPLLPDDSELGIWLFSTDLEGGRDWREVVPVGPLGERVGSVTRRQLILSELGRIRAERKGRTGLHESVLAAVRRMREGYKPEMVNTVLVFTDGRNQDADGPTLAQTVAALRREHDPNRPVQLIIQGYGPDVSVPELRALTEATGGLVQIARTPEDAGRLLLQAMSRRICSPEC